MKLKTVLESPESPGIDRKQLARNVLQASFHQLFVDGLFHGDPHPGNVIVLEGNRIGLLDFGLVGRMSRQMQETIVLLVLAISLRDPDTVARLLYKVGIPDQRINLQQFRHEIHDILDRYLGLKLSEVDSGVLMSELVDLAMKYRIKVPEECGALKGRRCTGASSASSTPSWTSRAALPYAKQLLIDRYNPGSMSGGLLRLLLQFQGFLQDTPQQLSQILMDLEGGKFNVTIRNEDLARLNTSLKALGLLLFAGMISSGLIVGAFFLAGRSTEGAGTTWPLPALIGLALAAMLFGAALTWTLLSGRFKKISLRRFFK